MPFGQLVIGPPGAGKTTYCEAMRRYLAARGRNVAIVNLDPANDRPPYECAVDIAALITVDDASAEYQLGPNGGLVYCFEYLAANVDWLVEQLRPLAGKYILFDCPGQVELYTHHEAVRAVTDGLASALDFRLVAVHLLDAHHCAEVSKYVSGLIVSLSAMLQLELPHVNVMSKVDLVESAGPLALPLSFYTDCADLERLLPFCEAAPSFSAKHAALTARLCELVDDFSLLHFIPCCVQDEDTLRQVLVAADKACGFAFGADERNNHGLFATAAGLLGSDYDRVAAVADRYTGHVARADEARADEVWQEGGPAQRPSQPLDGSDADALAKHYREELFDDDRDAHVADGDAGDSDADSGADGLVDSDGDEWGLGAHKGPARYGHSAETGLTGGGRGNAVSNGAPAGSTAQKRTAAPQANGAGATSAACGVASGDDASTSERRGGARDHDGTHGAGGGRPDDEGDGGAAGSAGDADLFRPLGRSRRPQR